MPTYEIMLIMKKIARPQLVEALKRTGQHIYDNEGYIRKVESLGERRLPNRKNAKGERHYEGNYITMECDLKTRSVERLCDLFGRDKEVIQQYVVALNEQDESVCPRSYDDELLPPSERPSIQALIASGRRPPKFRKIFSDKTGLDYYPFHR